MSAKSLSARGESLAFSVATSIEVVIRSVGATSAWADSFAKLSWAGT